MSPVRIQIASTVTFVGCHRSCCQRSWRIRRGVEEEDGRSEVRSSEETQQRWSEVEPFVICTAGETGKFTDPTRTHARVPPALQVSTSNDNT